MTNYGQDSYDVHCLVRTVFSEQQPVPCVQVLFMFVTVQPMLVVADCQPAGGLGRRHLYVLEADRHYLH
jgi:hypothetical protein